MPVVCRFVIICAILISVLAASGPASAAYTVPVNLEPLTAPEKWVLQQVDGGEDAIFPLTAKRTLRPQFIAALLTHGFKGVTVPYQGVRIVNALIGGPQQKQGLNLENAEVGLAVLLQNCVFYGPVNLKSAHFQKTLNFTGSTFKQGLNAWHLRTDQDVMLGMAHLQGPVNFRWAKIGGNFFARGANFKNAPKFDGNSMMVGGSLFIKEAEFHVPVDLVGAKIAQNLEGEDVKFFTSGGEINFNNLETGKNIFLRRSLFNGPVDLGAVRVGDDLDANGARFGDFKVSFSGLRVQNSLIVENVDFQGPVDFSGAQVGYNFDAKGTRFGSRAKAIFSSLHVGRSLLMGHSQGTRKPTSFLGPALFEFLSVGFNAYLFETEFHDQAFFFRSSIANDFLIVRTKFLAARPVSFNSLQAGYVSFQNNSYHGNVDLANATCTDLSIGAGSPRGTAKAAANKGKNPINQLILSGVLVKRNLTLSGITVKNLVANFLQVQGAATFKQVRFQDMADFKYAGFQVLRFLKPKWPPLKGQVRNVWLDRATYTTITSTNELLTTLEVINQDHARLLKWLETFQFNIENYGQLENYARRAGYSDWADEIYIAGKRRELRQEPFSLTKIITWVFWDRLAGFGRKPFWVVFWAVAIVFFGAIVFDPSYVVETQSLQKWDWAREILEMKSKREVLRSCWQSLFIKPDRHKLATMLKYFFGIKVGLSIDIFIPTHHPVLVHRWDRYAIPNGMRFYYYLHRVLGLILVPIAAAAFFIHFHIGP